MQEPLSPVAAAAHSTYIFFFCKGQLVPGAPAPVGHLKGCAIDYVVDV